MNENRGAIVVGGAGGIGGAICQRLGSEGYKVTVADYNLERAQEVARSLEGAGHHAVRVDVTDPVEVDAVFDGIEARDPASVLVVATGGLLAIPAPGAKFTDMGTELWNSSIAYNLNGMFFCMRKFGALRIANPIEHARIITITSGAGQFGGTPTDIAYVASKAALIGMTRQVAYDLVDAGVTVNTIAPGPIGTPEFMRNTNEQVRAAAARITIMDRLGTTEEIAAGAAFLASTEASYITGTTLDINGGSHTH
jgi:NAD(P)-dependent dehydrogenase (short-subunit alcohol dehydrogenase family)